jgi:apolipoprotein N-acyltransferase
LQQTNWDEALCLKATINLNNTTTFYGNFGDYIGRISVFIAAMLLIVSFVKARLKK